MMKLSESLQESEMKSPDEPIDENNLCEKKIELTFWHRCYMYFLGRGIQRNAAAQMAKHIDSIHDEYSDVKQLEACVIEDNLRIKELEAQLAECQRERDFERKEKENALSILSNVTDTCKALENERDALCKWIGKDVVESRDKLEKQLAECQKERDALREALQNINTGVLPNISGKIIVNDTIKGYAKKVLNETI